MVTLFQIQKVFEGEGFLCNYKSNPRLFAHTPCGIIKLCNPVKLLNRLFMYGYYYDKCLFDSMINSKQVILKDYEIVFSEWESKIYNTPDELLKYTKKNSDFYYEEYAK